MDPKNLDSALRSKAEACTTPEEILALAKEEGYTLTDDELDQISGGGFWSEGPDGPTCPHCGSDSTWKIDDSIFKCLDCGWEFT